MTNKKYQAVKTKAEKQVKQVDDFISKMMMEDKYFAISLIMKRLLKVANDYDIEDMCFELEIGANIKTFKIESLVQEIRFESFVNELKTNPYQLELIA